jgi:hypothetical protein
MNLFVIVTLFHFIDIVLGGTDDDDDDLVIVIMVK